MNPLSRNHFIFHFLTSIGTLLFLFPLETEARTELTNNSSLGLLAQSAAVADSPMSALDGVVTRSDGSPMSAFDGVVTRSDGSPMSAFDGVVTRNSDSGGMVPASERCDFNDLMRLGQTIIDFLIFKIAAPIAALMFAYAGFLYITAGGNEGQVGKAHGIFMNVAVGFVIALAAWLLVNFVVNFFVDSSYSLLGS